MKTSVFKSLSVFALVAVLAAGTVILTSKQEASAEQKTNSGDILRKITVTGTSAVKVKPDIAYVNLGVMTESKEATDAQSANSERMTAVIAAIKAMGIADADIKTSNYNIYPKYDYSNNKNTIIGYQVSNSVNVTVRKLDDVGGIVDAAIDAGANTANGITFSISDSSPYYAEALKLAIAQAKSKAKSIASAIGVTVDTPIEIIEQGGTYAPVAYAENAKMMAGGVARDAAMPVSPGELEVTAYITAIFAY